MDSQRPVLLCAQRRNTLALALLDTGHVPLMRNRLDDALRTLRHEQIEGIVIDGSSTDIDVLEFVLNARDMKPSVAIVVMAPETMLRELKRAFDELDGICTLPSSTPPEQAVAALERFFAHEG